MPLVFTSGKSSLVFPRNLGNTRVMIFVDGENLAIRYGAMLENDEPYRHVHFKKDTYVWSDYLNIPNQKGIEVIRSHYYTSLTGDQEKIESVQDYLIDLGIKSPKVFKKVRNRRSKRVDISLSVDMLKHAHRKNYDIAILVAGDEDYVPLVEAVKDEGCRVFLWFLSDGLSESLKRGVDHYFNLDYALFNPEPFQIFRFD